MMPNDAYVTLALPLTPEHWAELKIRHPTTEAEWSRLLAILEAVRPAMVIPDAAGPTHA